jgi:hypothetical protein
MSSASCTGGSQSASEHPLFACTGCSLDQPRSRLWVVSDPTFLQPRNFAFGRIAGLQGSPREDPESVRKRPLVARMKCPARVDRGASRISRRQDLFADRGPSCCSRPLNPRSWRSLQRCPERITLYLFLPT